MNQPTALDIAQLRDESGMGLEEFGALVYASARTVYSWEQGERACSLPAWELLQVYFGKVPPRVRGGRKSKRQAQELQSSIGDAMASLRAVQQAFAEFNRGGAT